MRDLAPRSLLGRPVAALAATLALLAGATVPAAAADRASIKVNQEDFRTKEAVWITGKVPGKKSGVKVYVYMQDLKTGKRGHVATVRSNSKGTFKARIVPSGSSKFYVKVKGHDTSKKVSVAKASGKRTLEDRARTAFSLGSPQGGKKTLSRSKSSSVKGASVDRVRHRNYAKALLVEVTKGSTVRTWRVDGKIRKAYLKAGGPTGKYGVPLGDARCHLIEEGCIQRFTNGALYENKNIKKATGQTGRTRETELLATARSQLSYRSTRLKSKFNKWTGSVGQPWCSAFVSWVSAASGNGSVIPKRARLYQLIPEAKKTMRTYKNSSKREPRLGTLAFFDFGGRGEATHVGFVIKATKSKLYTLEGNASKTAKFTAKRGVFLHERPRYRVNFYADLRW